MENTTINNTRLSSHFRLGEFISLHKYPDNKPTMQHVANMTYGCLMLLEPRHPTPPLHQNWLLQIKSANTLTACWQYKREIFP